MSTHQKEKKMLLTTKGDFKDFFSDKYILALDKDMASLVHYKNLFTKSVIFNNQVEAVNVTKIQKFDLFILELYQYPINGVKILKLLKDSMNYDTPALLITSSVFNEILFKHFDYYLFKPVKEMDIYYAAHKLIQK